MHEWEPTDGPYETHGDELVFIGTDDTPLSPRALEALGEHPAPAVVNVDDEPDAMDWYASAADERLAEQYDRDEDMLREQQAGA